MSNPTVHEILADRAASDWLKAALRGALVRDPIDALNDAEVMAAALRQHAEQIQADANAFDESHVNRRRT